MVCCLKSRTVEYPAGYNDYIIRVDTVWLDSAGHPILTKYSTCGGSTFPLVNELMLDELAEA